MSRYSGRQGRGAARLVRELKQDQAEARNADYQARQRAAQQTPDTPTPDDALTINYSGESLLNP